MNYASSIKECPHCGVLVLFSAESICPSCCENGNEPVLNHHIEKIALNRYNDLLRKNSDENRNKISEVNTKQSLYIIFFILGLFKLLLFYSRNNLGY